MQKITHAVFVLFLLICICNPFVLKFRHKYFQYAQKMQLKMQTQEQLIVVSKENLIPEIQKALIDNNLIDKTIKLKILYENPNNGIAGFFGTVGTSVLVVLFIINFATFFQLFICLLYWFKMMSDEIISLFRPKINSIMYKIDNFIYEMNQKKNLNGYNNFNFIIDFIKKNKYFIFPFILIGLFIVGIPNGLN